jgi:YqaJ-like viral recombinase domain
MKVHNVQQNTDAWRQLRAGIPTASQFHKIITPGLKASSQQEGYMFHLIAERIMGRPIEPPAKGKWMERGHELEASAIQFYELQRDMTVQKVGFITNDEGTVGCSPDGLVGDEGMLEIKVPAEHTHVGYLITKSVDTDYHPQAQGQLWLSGRKWNDVMSFHPEMPAALIRVERDSKYIRILEEAVMQFVSKVDSAYRELKERNMSAPQPRTAPTLEEVVHDMNLTEVKPGVFEQVAENSEAKVEATLRKIKNAKDLNELARLSVMCHDFTEQDKARLRTAYIERQKWLMSPVTVSDLGQQYKTGDTVTGSIKPEQKPEIDFPAVLKIYKQLDEPEEPWI